jgi:hypothetical protein
LSLAVEAILDPKLQTNQLIKSIRSSMVLIIVYCGCSSHDNHAIQITEEVVSLMIKLGQNRHGLFQTRESTKINENTYNEYCHANNNEVDKLVKH